jgi:hypothetical protein
MKEHLLHSDVKAGDRLFYFTTCGWMMWNWLVSGLGSGAALMLYDGSPFIDRGKVLWDYADAERFTHFGTSAKYIDHAKKIGVVPRKDYALTHLRTLLSTGSPLAPESFDYVYQCVKSDICLSSDRRRHRHRLVLRARQSDAARVAWRAAVPRARHARRTSTTMTAGLFRRARTRRASSSARRRFRRCRSASGTTPAM